MGKMDRYVAEVKVTWTQEGWYKWDLIETAENVNESSNLLIDIIYYYNIDQKHIIVHGKNEQFKFFFL